MRPARPRIRRAGRLRDRRRRAFPNPFDPVTNSTLRILTGLVGIPAVLGLIYLGGWPFAVAVIGVGMIAQGELYALAAGGEMRPYQGFGLIFGGFILAQPMLAALLPLTGVLVAGMLLLLLSFPFLRDDDLFRNAGATLFGVIYPSFLFSFLIRVRLYGPETTSDGFWLTLLLFLLIWAADTFAYFVGKHFGRRLFFPRISPKKTWEGFFGGLLGAIGVAMLVVFTLPTPFGPIDGLALAAVAGIGGPLGDLAESRLKRAVGAKDSGHILPGHGGLLDRFDALLVAAPLFWAYAYLVMR